MRVESAEPHLSLAVAAAPQRERSERLLTTERVTSFMNDVVARTAATAWVIIQHGPKKWPEEEEHEAYKVRLDDGATGVMEGLFDQSDFGVNVFGSEGAKERRKRGKKAAVRIITGYHGGHDKTLGSVYSDIDSVEGTDLAATGKGKEGAVSVAASSLAGNVALIPPDFATPEGEEETDAVYMRRTAGSEDWMGIDPEMGIKDMIEVARRNTGIINPSQVEIVILERATNGALIEESRASGATVTLIDNGDFVPGVAAVLRRADMSVAAEKRRLLLSLGRGGKEEAVALAMVARTKKKAVFWGRYEDRHGKPSEQFPGLKTLEQLLPGEPKDFTTSVASITGINSRWFDLPPVRLHVNGNPEPELLVVGFDITANGFTPTLHSYRRAKKSLV